MTTGGIKTLGRNVSGISQLGVTYSYDHLSRLTSSSSSQGAVWDRNVETGIRYSDNGNIAALRRVTVNGDRSLTFTHEGNRLASMTGGTASTFAHDTDGRLVSDSGRNLSQSYNALGLTDKITGGGTMLDWYAYLSDGTELIESAASPVGEYYG